jgi:YidC/Oxa1 family membrane protein insertase
MGNIFTILLTAPLTNGLIAFYRVLGGNLGLAIIGFSIFLRIISAPLQKPYLANAKKMKEIAPLVTKLKKKYKDDKQGFLKAQADLYKEKGINPGAGCLPYLLQIVILIALFRVFTSVLSDHGAITESINSILYTPLKFMDGQSLNTKFLYLDITQPDKFVIPGLPFPLPGPLLLLAALVQFLSAKISMPMVEKEKQVAEKTKGEGDDFQVAMQSSMIYTFPLMTILVGVGFPSGLALYWFIFSIMQAYTQYQMFGWGGLTPWVHKARTFVSRT